MKKPPRQQVVAAAAPMPEAPLLQTERLTLRAMRPEDLSVLQELWCDPVVYKFITGRASLPEETWSAILRHAGQWQVLGYGYWVAIERASGALVGQMGYGDFKRTITPSLQGKPELGWALFPAHHNKGYGLESTTAIQAWGDQNLAADFTSCIIAPENLASLKLAGKLGFRLVTATIYNDNGTLVYERQRFAT